MMAKPFHLHIENLRRQSEVFHITPARYQAVAERFPQAAGDLQVTFGWDNERFDTEMATANALIGWRFPHDHLASLAPNLEWIHLTGAGIEHVMPLDWLPPTVALTNNRGVHAAKAGEYVAMAVLALNARIPAYVTLKNERRWQQTFSSGIAGKTIAIVGVGNMGRAAALRCQALGMHVMGVRASGQGADGVDAMFLPTELDSVLSKADFLLVSVPSTPLTRGLIGRHQLDKLKLGAGVINIARAPVVDYVALAERLSDGRISGAFLDVFDPEPLPADDFLWDVPNLIMTPHVSSDDAERYAMDTVALFFTNLERMRSGLALMNLVDPKRQY